jgi:hypothetical protein
MRIVADLVEYLIQLLVVIQTTPLLPVVEMALPLPVRVVLNVMLHTVIVLAVMLVLDMNVIQILKYLTTVQV